MKNSVLCILSILISLFSVNAQSQWITSGENITYEDGNVGIGDTYFFPNSLLHVSDNSALSSGQTKNLIEITHHTDVNNIGARFGIRFSSPISGGLLKKGTAIYNVSEDVYMNKNGLAFHVSNNYNNEPAERMRLDSRGYLGIGTSSPNSKLDIYLWGDHASLLKFNMERPWDFIQRGTGPSTNLALRSLVNSKSFIIQSPLGVQNARFLINDTPSLNKVILCQEGGKVGIGTSNLDEMLTVNGKIHAEEVRVSSVPSSDYVFEPDYNLKSLQEVESFIRQNRHLPDIPSAQEFKENGVGLGEMDDMLLRKVEELTLYMITLQKKYDDLQKKYDTIVNQMENK